MAANFLRFRFGLRTLLLVMLVFGCGLGWWLRPHTVSRRWPNGKLQYQLRLRRAWNGELVTSGQQRWWWSNGQLARTGVSSGQVFLWNSAWNDLQDVQCWHKDGQPMNHNDFGVYWFGASLDDPQGESLGPQVNWSNYRFPETEHDP
jgi:hypothetical protein